MKGTYDPTKKPKKKRRKDKDKLKKMQEKYELFFYNTASQLAKT